MLRQVVLEQRCGWTTVRLYNGL